VAVRIAKPLAIETVTVTINDDWRGHAHSR